MLKFIKAKARKASKFLISILNKLNPFYNIYKEIKILRGEFTMNYVMFSNSFNDKLKDTNNYIQNEKKNRLRQVKDVRDNIQINIKDLYNGTDTLCEDIQDNNNSLLNMTNDLEATKKVINKLKITLDKIEKIEDIIKNANELNKSIALSHERYVSRLKQEATSINYEYKQHKFMDRLTSLETRLTQLEIDKHGSCQEVSRSVRQNQGECQTLI